MRKVCHENASVQALTIYVRSRKPFKIFATALEKCNHLCYNATVGDDGCVGNGVVSILTTVSKSADQTISAFLVCEMHLVFNFLDLNKILWHSISEP